MKHSFKSLHLMAVVPALFLAGCGEGYELVRYEGFPYANARTAGSGVAYVRANLMPEKGASTQPALQETSKILKKLDEPKAEPAPPEPKTEQLLDSAEKIFDGKLKK